jgi:hypothetical protein
MDCTYTSGCYTNCSTIFTSKDYEAKTSINLFQITFHHIVAYLLKARTVEPEKQPLLANGSETTFIFT